MPPVKFFESLDLDPIGLFLDGHYLRYAQEYYSETPRKRRAEGSVGRVRWGRRRFSVRFFLHQFGDGVLQFQRKGLRHLMILEVLAEFDRLFQGVQAYLAGFAGSDVRFDIFTGRGVKLLIDVLGKPLKQGHAVLMGMVRISPFHNSFSALL
jgi:hypothetical protein